TVTSPMSGQATLTAAQMADLLGGKWYANIHTARYPGGEIRGQMTVRN
ncbi:MAG: CHRD domain-containing protein, partial [Polaromonas sp.]|nr:CHRD domain-containing protein [Polaromonas sp.]